MAVDLPWDSHESPMGLPQGFHGFAMFPWVSHGIPTGIPLDSHATLMGLYHWPKQLPSVFHVLIVLARGSPMGLPRDHGAAMGVPRDSRGCPRGRTYPMVLALVSRGTSTG